MRLPVVVPLSTKDGTSNKNARLTNCLKESKQSKDAFVWVRGVKQPAPPIDKAVIRPGLVLEAEGSGVGGGIVAFDNDLVSVYGTTLGFSITEPAFGSSTLITTIGASVVGNGTIACNGSTVIVAGTAPDVRSSSDGVTFSVVSSESFSRLYSLGSTYFGWDTTTKFLRKSVDSGATWDTGTDFSSENAAGYTFSFFCGQGSNAYMFFYKAGFASHKYSSIDSGATWSGPVAAATMGADIGTTGQAVYFSGKFYQVVTGGSGEVIETSDVFSSYSTVFTPATFSTGGIPVLVVDSGKLKFLGLYSGNEEIYIYESSNGTAWDSGTFVLTATPETVDFYSIFILNGVLTIFYYALGNYVVSLGAGGAGTIPALATIATGIYDFAQSSL